MIKKALALTFAVIILIGVSALSGCWQRNYRWNEDSFSFEVTADREYARIGDEVKVTTTFRNLSGRNLLVTVTIPVSRRMAYLEDIIRLGCYETLHSRHSQTLRLPVGAVVAVNSIVIIDIFHYFGQCFFCGMAIFYMGRTNHAERLWEAPRAVFLEAEATINIISEDETHA